MHALLPQHACGTAGAPGLFQLCCKGGATNCLLPLPSETAGLDECCQACIDLDACCVWAHFPLGEQTACFLFAAGEYGSYESPTGEVTGLYSADQCEGTVVVAPE